MLQSGKFTVTGEVGPPHGSDYNLVTERTRLVKDYCDAINITDNVRGIPTMSSMACAHFVIEAGAEPVMQMSARDRNRILFESELYGAHALGIRNILFVTGDHTLLGSHPQAKMVYDLDSIQALQLASHLMSGKDLAGEELEGVPLFHLGATFNPNADPLELQVWRVEKKRDAGAQFFQTQAVYDTGRLEEYMEQIEPLGVKVLAGVIPLKGPKMARFMNERIPGIRIQEETINRLESAGAGMKGEERKEAVRAEGIEITLEIINHVKKIRGINGIHIMAIGWEESIPELVKASGLYPRPR
jgi:methylenetetrahydrofolate reductase (NADPH)